MATEGSAVASKKKKKYRDVVAFLDSFFILLQILFLSM